MGNTSIVEWVSSIDPKTRKKPNRSLRQEVVEKIISSLKNRECNYSEAINAITMFSSAMVDTFYSEFYWDLPDKMRTKWNHAFYNWAENKKPVKQAFSRMILTIKYRLTQTEDCSELENEIRWMAINLNGETDTYLRTLVSDSRPTDLVKLLRMDMSGWKYGRTQTEKMMEKIFTICENQKSKECYAAYLARNGKAQKNAVCITQPVEEKIERIAPECRTTQANQPVEQVRNNDSSQIHQVPAAEVQPKEEVAVAQTEKPAIEQKKALLPNDGVALAEALVKWAQAQKENSLAQAEQNAMLATEVQKQRVQIDALSEKVAHLSAAIEKLEIIRTNLEADIAAIQTENEALKAAKEKAECTIGQVQQMSENSAKQELDGFKARLASALANDVKDFRQEYTEEEKAEVYGAFLEDMISILKSHGISMEDE